MNTKQAKRRRDLQVWLTLNEVALRVGRHRQTIWRWRKEGRFPPPDGQNPAGFDVWHVDTVDGQFANAA